MQLAWKRADNGQIHACHAGLLCISAPIEVDDQPVAITAGCQFVTQAPGGAIQIGNRTCLVWPPNWVSTRKTCGLPLPSVRLVPEKDLARISRLVGRVADTFSEIGQERLNLLSRLQHIAEMSKV